MENKYWITKNKNLAVTLSYILGRKLFILDDKFDPAQKCYSFVNDEKFQLVIAGIYDLRVKHNELKNK